MSQVEAEAAQVASSLAEKHDELIACGPAVLVGLYAFASELVTRYSFQCSPVPPEDVDAICADHREKIITELVQRLTERARGTLQ